MIPRRRPSVLLWCIFLATVVADETPPGLVSKDSDQDLIAEASHKVSQQAQKREAALSNSYGEPLPSDAYGPPREIPIVPDIQQPAQVYGVPEPQNIFQTPPGAYGPPSPIVFPSQSYEGPPPPFSKPKPQYGPPKTYGPPKLMYGPPKPQYGPPKKTYGVPKQSLPKQSYGAPFKPPKISFPKPIYGVPKPAYGPPKPIYGPPKATYGPPLNIPLQDFPQASLSHSSGSFGSGLDGGISNNIDLGLNLPAPIYGTPLGSFPGDLAPNFPIPTDTYGPPGHTLGPIGPNDQVVLQGGSNVGHYGPPQPDPNPRPPHPGIPAPPTPPHVLYDGWKPIPGVSQPPIEHAHIEDHYGPPPPPPPSVHDIQINFDSHSLPNIDQSVQFSGAQITTGYSGVHQDTLGSIDLNSIIGGDSNNIDQSKTIYEAHYTEGQNPHNDLAIVHTSIPSGHAKPLDTYGVPPLDSFSSGPYPASIRQHGAKGLIPPSGIYGVPPGSQYGAPPKPPPSHLPIPYGSFSGGGHSIHTGGSSPRHPIKFRESVPEGLLQQVGHVTHHKDVHGIEHLGHGPTYLPPPIKDVKDQGNHGINSLSLSIEPSNLYSLPHAGNPITFHGQAQPSSLYGSPVDSYSVPLFTVSDHAGSFSNLNEVKATVDGSILANLSNLDAAAILKHCPYHEAILKAAKLGDKIPSDLASSYVASLSSLGSTLSKGQQTLISPQNSFNKPAPGSESVSYHSKDLSSASHTLVQTIIPSNGIKAERYEKNIIQKGKAIRDSGKHSFKQENALQSVTDQIQQTSEKIKNLSEATKQLQQKIVSTNQNINQVSGQITQFDSDIPIKGKLGSYSLQIQSADDQGGKGGVPSVPHDQLLSEGLLQSILQAIEQPSPNQKQKNIHYASTSNINFANLSPPTQVKNQNLNFAPSSHFASLQSLQNDGLILPAGYEPIDRTKEKHVAIDQEIQGTNKDIKKMLHHEMIHKHRGDIPQTDCDLRADNSIRHTIVVPPPQNFNNIQPINDFDENDVAVYFGDAKTESTEKEPVTEISVATSISENIEEYDIKSPEFGEKINKKQS